MEFVVYKAVTSEHFLIYSELQSRIEELETENSTKYDTINNLQSNLGLSKAECKELQAEMAVINQVNWNNNKIFHLFKLKFCKLSYFPKYWLDLTTTKM